MWPLDSAKMDSVWASRSRCSSRSGTLQASTAKTSCPIIGVPTGRAWHRGSRCDGFVCHRLAVGLPRHLPPDGSGSGHGPFGDKAFKAALIGCVVLVIAGVLMVILGGQAPRSVGA